MRPYFLPLYIAPQHCDLYSHSGIALSPLRETSAIYNILQELKGKYTTDVASVYITKCVAEPRAESLSNNYIPPMLYLILFTLITGATASFLATKILYNRSVTASPPLGRLYEKSQFGLRHFIEMELT